MKDNLINEVFGLNSKEKKLFFKKTNFNYNFSSFSEFKKTYEDITEETKTFFLGYKNKNNINKIPKTFEILFFWYLQNKKISDKTFLELKEKMNDSSFNSDYKVYTIFDIVNVVNELNKNNETDYKTFSYLQYKEQAPIINAISKIIKSKKINLKNIIQDIKEIEETLLIIKRWLEQDKTIKVVYTEDEYIEWLYGYYNKLIKEIDLYFKKKKL